MDIRAVFDAVPSRCPPPGDFPLLIPGKRGKLFSQLYTPGGEGLHPAVLLSHGYPGNEKNLDLAQFLRALGFAVMIYHYSGSWGSDGDFSLHHCIEDANTLLDAMIANAEAWQLDPGRIYAVGHSMGGFVTAHLLAQRRELKGGVLIAPWDVARTYALSRTDKVCRANLEEVLAGGYGWLTGWTSERAETELSQHTDALRLDRLGGKLHSVPLLLIGCTQDTITPVLLHQQPLRDSIGDAEALTYSLLPGDHSMHAYRALLWETVGQWLLRQEG